MFCIMIVFLYLMLIITNCTCNIIVALLIIDIYVTDDIQFSVQVEIIHEVLC